MKIDSQDSRTRTLRVFVAWWVIGDKSFPLASIGDLVDVSLELYPSGATPTVCDESRTAIARPAYGVAPRACASGEHRWLHLIYGDGWSGTWWADRYTEGPVSLSGIFSAGLEDGPASDRPSRTYGRVTRLHLVDRQVRPRDNGWAQIPGTDRLTEIGAVPSDLDWWPAESAVEGDFVPAGVLVELDLDVATDPRPQFQAGSLSAFDDTLWVLDRREPTLVRVDTSTSPPQVGKFTLPLALELDNGMWSRRIHAFDGGYWVTSGWDIHRFTYTADGNVEIDRYTTDGGSRTALHEGRLYVIGMTRDGMSSDRRYGAISSPIDVHALQVLDENERKLLPVKNRELLKAVDRSSRRADRAIVGDGSEWRIVAPTRVQKIGNPSSAIDLDTPTDHGTVRVTTPDPWKDPANAAIVAAITIDASSFRRIEKPDEV